MLSVKIVKIVKITRFKVLKKKVRLFIQVLNAFKVACAQHSVQLHDLKESVFLKSSVWHCSNVQFSSPKIGVVAFASTK